MGTLRWDEITPELQVIRLHSITEPTTTWALPTGRHHLLLTVQADATITPTEGDPVTAAPAHAVHISPQASSAPMTVHPGPTPWQAIVITYPTPNDHTHTWQQRWGDIRGDLLQEHLGLTRTHHTLHPKRGVDQAPHGIHTPGLWAYATPINPQAAEDLKTALSIQQAQTQTLQHPTRLHHLVGIPRPRHPQPPTRGPPSRHQHNRPPPSRSSGSHTARGPWKPGAHNTWSKPKWRPARRPKKSPQHRSPSKPQSSWTRPNTPPRTNGRPTTSSPTPPPARTTPPRSPSPATTPTPHRCMS